MKKVDLSKFDNSWYYPGSIIKRVAWLILGRLFVNTYLPIPMAIKLNVLRLFGATIGSGVVIKPKVNIKYPWFLEIGDNAWIGEKAWIDNFCKVKIGSHACISQEAMLLTGNHNFKLTTFDLMVGEIELEEGVWIGAKSLVVQNIKAESHSILMAGSVLTKSMKAYEIWQGNPANCVKLREIVK